MGATISAGLICNLDVTLNFTNDEESATRMLYTAADRVIVPVLMSVIAVLGLLTNSTLLLVVYRVRHMRTATNQYLVQIALADVLYLLFGAGAKVLRFANSPVSSDLSWTGEAGCILTPLFTSVAYFAILFFMTLVTREKFLAICKPLRYRLINGSYRVRMTLAAWGVALLASSTLVPCSSVFTRYCIIWPLAWEQEDLPSVIARCRPVKEWLIPYNDAMQVSPFFIVMLLTLSMDACIIKSLRVQVAAQTEHQMGPMTARKMQTRRQVTRMLVVSGVAFFCFLAPFECCSIAASLRMYTQHPLLETDQFRLLSQTARTLAYFQAAINPLVYYLLHPRYRKACVETFSGRINARRQDVNPTSNLSCLTVAKETHQL